MAGARDDNIDSADAAARLAEARARRHDPLPGLAWTTLAMALFAGMSAVAKHLTSAGLPPLEVVFFRNLSATLLLLPVLAWRGWALMRSNSLHLYGLRVLVALVSMMSWFTAVSMIPLGELTAISFLAPLFGTVGAVLLLGEKVRARRLTALALGFLGAMIILRPGGQAFGWGQALALISAMSAGISVVLVKQLTFSDDPEKIVFLTNLMMTPLSLVPALFVWKVPALQHVPWMLALGVFAVLGHLALTRAFTCCEASLILTFEFSKLPFAVAVAYLVFGELTDVWTWVGATIIFASALYITQREAQLRRERLKAEAQRPSPD